MIVSHCAARVTQGRAGVSSDTYYVICYGPVERNARLIVAGNLDKLDFNANGISRMREFKKYPNRRLYDIQDSCYVTVEDVRKIILAGETISVIDSKTDKNLTRTVLLQIIAEQECSGKAPVLTNNVLEHLIRFNEDQLKSVMSEHIEQSINHFLAARNQYGQALHSPEMETIGGMSNDNAPDNVTESNPWNRDNE